MAASRLSIYQGACLVLGDRKVVSLTENVQTRKELDGVWDRNGVKTCLQSGLWNFATRGVQLDYSPSVSPPFGYERAFEKPTDFVRLSNICTDEFFKHVLNNYEDEAGYWFASYDTIYVRYVSNDVDYGMDYAKWPENFTRFVEHYFALQICDRVTGGARKKQDVEKDTNFWLKKALGTDAAEEPTKFLPSGSWVRARAGNRGRYRDEHGRPVD